MERAVSAIGKLSRYTAAIIGSQCDTLIKRKPGRTCGGNSKSVESGNCTSFNGYRGVALCVDSRTVTPIQHINICES